MQQAGDPLEKGARLCRPHLDTSLRSSLLPEQQPRSSRLPRPAPSRHRPEPTPAPTAEAAAPGLLPKCVNEGGAEALGGSSTECATPGNVQINDTPAEEPYVGPWGDMFGGDGFFFP